MSAKSPRLTKRAKELLELAQEAAVRQGRDEIDTEDLLLGMLSQVEGTAYKALRSLGVENILQVETILKSLRSGADVDNLPPVLYFLLDENSNVLNATPAAQTLLDSHEAEILNGISFDNGGDLSEFNAGDQRFVSRTSRLSDGTKAVNLYEKVRDLNFGTELGQFSSMIRQDLISPVVIIKGDVKLLPKVVDLGDNGTRFVERIAWAANQLLHMINDLHITLSNWGTHIPGPTQHPCDLKLIVSEKIANLKERKAFQSISFSLDIPDNDWRIWGDNDHLGRLIEGLTWQALDRVPVDTTVTIALSRNSEGIWLRVQDHGPTIGDGFRTHVVEPDTRSFPAGLALDFVAKEHYGRPEIRNLPEGGAEFAVLFPSAIVISAGEDASHNPTPS